MQLLVVSQYYWPETFRITEVVQSLRKAGCDVTVLTGQPNYPDGRVHVGYNALSLCSEQHGGGTLHRVPLIPRGRGTSLQLALNYLSFAASACIAGPWLLRRRAFDAVLVYAPSPILQVIPGVLLKWLKHAALITWVQDLWPESLQATGHVNDRKLLAAVAAVVRWIYRRNDLLLVQSRAFIDVVRAAAPRTPLAYHPNPGELAFAATAPPEVPAALHLENGFNVVFAGNLGTVQALDTVLAAAALLQEHDDIRWVLVGSGSRSAWALEEVRSRRLDSVSLPGRFPPDAMPGILAQADALLVSLVRSPIMGQTVPSKVQAYLAAGRPIIAALDGEGARVVEEAGAGLACAAEDAQALADAVLRLRALPAGERQRMGEAGRRFYQAHFDPDTLAVRLLQHLDNAVRTSRGGTIVDSPTD